MNTIRITWLLVVTVVLGVPNAGFGGPPLSVPVDLRIVRDLSELDFAGLSRAPDKSWLILSMAPTAQGRDYGDLDAYTDPLTKKTMPLPGAGGTVSRIVGIAEVKAVLSGRAPKSPFVYAWAEKVDAGSEATPKTWRSHTIEWPFKFRAGCAICEYDPSAIGHDALPRVYAIPDAFADDVLPAFQSFEKDRGLYDRQFVGVNRDRLRAVLVGKNSVLACVAAHILATAGDSASLIDAIPGTSGIERAAVVLLALRATESGSSDSVEREIGTAIDSARTTDDLHPLALGLAAARLDAADAPAEARAARILDMVRKKYQTLSGSTGKPDDYLASLFL